MKVSSKVIVGSALTLGAVLVAIDHTRHPLPEAKRSAGIFSALVKGGSAENPCSLKPPPCSLKPPPCSL
jgi:hypothetical protein